MLTTTHLLSAAVHVILITMTLQQMDAQPGNMALNTTYIILSLLQIFVDCYNVNKIVFISCLSNPSPIPISTPAVPIPIPFPIVIWMKMIAANYPHILLLLVTNVLQIDNVYKLHS